MYERALEGKIITDPSLFEEAKKLYDEILNGGEWKGEHFHSRPDDERKDALRKLCQMFKIRGHRDLEKPGVHYAYLDDLLTASRYEFIIKEQGYSIGAKVLANNTRVRAEVVGYHWSHMLKIRFLDDKVNGRPRKRSETFISPLEVVPFDPERISMAETPTAKRHIEQAATLAKAAEYYLLEGDYGRAEDLLKESLSLIEKARHANGGS